jgi:hypothetical protein
VSSSIGLAGMGALVSTQSAQLSADQGALVQSSSSIPQIEQMVQQGGAALAGYYQQVQLHVLAAAYSEVFLTAAVLTAVCIALAVTLRKPAPVPTTAAPAPVATAAPVARPAPVTRPVTSRVTTVRELTATRRVLSRTEYAPEHDERHSDFRVDARV